VCREKNSRFGSQNAEIWGHALELGFSFSLGILIAPARAGWLGPLPPARDDAGPTTAVQDGLDGMAACLLAAAGSSAGVEGGGRRRAGRSLQRTTVARRWWIGCDGAMRGTATVFWAAKNRSVRPTKRPHSVASGARKAAAPAASPSLYLPAPVSYRIMEAASRLVVGVAFFGEFA